MDESRKGKEEKKDSSGRAIDNDKAPDLPRKDVKIVTKPQEELAERLSLFAAVAEEGEEMIVEITATGGGDIVNSVDSLCRRYNLRYRHEDDVGQANAPVADRPAPSSLVIFKDSTTVTTITEEEIAREGLQEGSDERKNVEEEGAREKKEKRVIESVDTVLRKEVEKIDITDSVPPARKAPARKAPARKDKGTSKTSTNGVSKANALLGSLARERAARSNSSNTPKSPPPPVPATNPPKNKKSKSKKSKKKKKNGSPTLPGAAAEDKEDAPPDDMDDFAFLDAQIEKVQTSHGRKIDAAGSGYRSIVNGVLLARPAEREAPRNARSAGALNSKIRAAQEGRRSKPKKK